MALADKFILAYGFFLLFGIWSTCCWFASDFLAKKQSRIRSLQKKAKRTNATPRVIVTYEENRRLHLYYFKLGVPALLVVLTGACFWWVQSAQIDYELQLPFGVLEPAGEPTPPNACDDAPSNALRVLLGPISSFGTNFPQRVLLLNNDPILSFDRDVHGNISVTTNIYDQNGDIVVEIKNNNFRVANDAFEVIHSDFSSLAVIIKHNKEKVLDIRYLNSQSIRVLGIFRHPNDPILEVKENGILLNGRPLRWRDVCAGNTLGADFKFTN